MRKIGIITSGLMISSLISGVVYLTLNISRELELVTYYFLFFYPVLIYLTILFIKIIKNREFTKNHKFTLHLLIWPFTIILLFCLYLVIIGLFDNYFIDPNVISYIYIILGTVISSVLSLVGYIIDLLLNRKK